MTTPALRATPPQRGTWPSSRRGTSSPLLEGWAQPGVVRECEKMHLLPITCHSRAWGPRKY